METSEASDSLITPSLRTLLRDIVDYAGLFPPADLSLRRAIQNYADYRGEAEAWMLSRFVLPVRRLPDLVPYRSLLTADSPYVFSVLGTGGDTPDAFLSAFTRDLGVIDDFDDEYGGQAQVDVMEVPLPSGLDIGSASAVGAFLRDLESHLVASGTAKLDLFLEVPGGGTPDDLTTLCATVADHNADQALPARSEVGLKIRCGGAEPSDVPSAGWVAALIAACRDAGVSFKATAGLHHPIRHYDDGLDTEMHGFLNIFGAAALAAEHDLDADALQPILRDESADHFRFRKASFAWKNLSVPLDGLRHARNALAVSFGSCSFEEPIDHLRDLELL